MRIKAAVLEEFGAPLVVREVELAEPQAGEVLGAAGRVRRLPHGSVHGVGRGSVGLCADGARARGRRGRRGGRDGRFVGFCRRPRRDAVLAAVPRVHPLRLGSHESLPRDPRAAEPRVSPRRDDALVAGRRAGAPLHGHVDVRGVHGDAGDRARAGQPRSAAGRRRAVCVRPVDGHRRRVEHGEGRAGLDVRRLRRGDGRARRRDRLPARGRRARRVRRPLGWALGAWRRTTARRRRWSAAPTRSSGSSR